MSTMGTVYDLERAKVLGQNADSLRARINRAIEYINDLDRSRTIDHDAAQEIKRRLLRKE